MTITSRPYAGAADLCKLQAATANWIASAGFAGYLHVGDIGLRLFNGMRQYDPRDIIRLWEDGSGSVLGWCTIYPRWNSYDALLHPAQRGGELEAQILDWGERETGDWMQREGRADHPISVEIFEEDAARISLLEQRGYLRDEQHHVIGVRPLNEAIPDIQLPNGFSIRSVEGEHEADKLVAVMNAAFGWAWTADEFRQFMRTPGYPNQLVVVARDGSLAAFCYLMLDTVNQIGMFEDVGTHPDFQRRGLGRALLYEGMKRMKEQGMETALVPYNATLRAASALYEAVGFQPTHNICHYHKAS